MSSKKPGLLLTSFDSYMKSSIEQLSWQLNNFFGHEFNVDVSHVSENLSDLNAYENLEHLKPLQSDQVIILDEAELDTKDAERAVINGEIFWEHAAAGEATRLGLGTKYMLALHELTIEKIIELRRREIEDDFKNDPEKRKSLIDELTPRNLEEQMGCTPEQILPMTLGERHILQLAFEIERLAKKHGLDADKIIKKQRMLLILNEQTSDQIVNNWIKCKFFGFNNKNIFFMVQRSFEGIHFENGKPVYDLSHDKHKRLHNHGQMAMQKTHENVIFFFDDSGSKKHITSQEFEKVLESCKNLVSYNIEDIGYLTNAIDWHSMALTLDLGKRGYAMVMEIVANNPLKPQFGGACFWDKKKQNVVMIELNQLKGLEPKDIVHLNKNFNNYPNPVISFRALKSGVMHLHTTVKKSVDKEGMQKDYIYFCTPQGDINFHVRTAYVLRKVLKPIANWKSPATTPPTVKACYEQDHQEGFRNFASKILSKRFS